MECAYCCETSQLNNNRINGKVERRMMAGDDEWGNWKME